MAALKPQDVLVALKYASQPRPWKQRDLAEAIGLSPSEVNHARRRLIASRLFNEREERVMRRALLEFITFGLPYAFPAQLELPSIGMPTAFSARPLANLLVGGADVAIWQTDKASVRGRCVEPLYPSAPHAASRDSVLYEYLALVDALRVGRARDRALAKDELSKRLSQ
jgi:hypothetical protein